MPFPQLAGIDGAGIGSGTSVWTPSPVIGAIASTDLLLALVHSTSGADTPVPSGWTEIAELNAFGRWLHLWARTGQTSLGFSIDRSGGANQYQAIFMRVSGWWGAIADGVAAALNGDGSGTWNAGAVNPAAWDIEETLWIAAGGRSGGSAPTGAPSNYTTLFTYAAFEPMAAAVRELAAASEDPGAFVGGSGGPLMATIAIRPAAAAGAALAGDAKASAQVSGAMAVAKNPVGATFGVATPAGTLDVASGRRFRMQFHLRPTPAQLAVGMQEDEGAPAASIANLNVRWWRTFAASLTQAPEVVANNASFDAAGWLDIAAPNDLATAQDHGWGVVTETPVAGPPYERQWSGPFRVE